MFYEEAGCILVFELERFLMNLIEQCSKRGTFCCGFQRFREMMGLYFLHKLALAAVFLCTAPTGRLVMYSCLILALIYIYVYIIYKSLHVFILMYIYDHQQLSALFVPS